MPQIFDRGSCFDFTCAAVSDDNFSVIEFEGVEKISTPYRFELILASNDPEIKPDDILSNPATLTVRQSQLFTENQAFQEIYTGGAGDSPFHGIVVEFEQMQQVGDLTFYKAVLVPRIWWMTIDCQNQVYIDQSVPEIIELELKQANLSPGTDFEFRLQNWPVQALSDAVGYGGLDDKSFPRWHYVCQYGESSLDFINRLMERDGLYYYFEQTDSAEKMIITNHYIHHETVAPKSLRYAPGENLQRGPNIQTLVMRNKRVPKTVFLRDYNYRRPSMIIEGQAIIDDQYGFGEVYYYGDHFKVKEEGNHLASIRAEEINCWRKTVRGDTTAAFLHCGFVCGVENHYRDEFNQDYNFIEVRHRGSQKAYLTAGLAAALGTEEGEDIEYRNAFVAIPANVQFRQPRKTPKPRIYAILNGHVDADYIDDKGRYKVRMPFDRAGYEEGKASRWCRLAKPFQGDTFGMHFPLWKGAEVLLSFIDGDPDRPIITGVMENPDNPSRTQNINVGVSRLPTGSIFKYVTKNRPGTVGPAAGEAGGGGGGGSYFTRAADARFVGATRAAFPDAKEATAGDRTNKRPTTTPAAPDANRSTGSDEDEPTAPFAATDLASICGRDGDDEVDEVYGEEIVFVGATADDSNYTVDDQTSSSISIGGDLPASITVPEINSSGSGSTVTRSNHGPLFGVEVVPFQTSETTDNNSGGGEDADKLDWYSKDVKTPYLSIYENVQVKESYGLSYSETFAGVRQYTSTDQGIYKILDVADTSGTMDYSFTFVCMDNYSTTGCTDKGSNIDEVNDHNPAYVKKTFGDAYSYHSGNTYTWAQDEVKHTYGKVRKYAQMRTAISSLSGDPKPDGDFNFPGVSETSSSVRGIFSWTYVPDSKSDGGVFSYLKGFSYKKAQGNTEKYRVGNEYSEIAGAKESMLYGNATKFTAGNVFSTLIGAKEDIHLGAGVKVGIGLESFGLDIQAFRQNIGVYGIKNSLTFSSMVTKLNRASLILDIAMSAGAVIKLIKLSAASGLIDHKGDPLYYIDSKKAAMMFKLENYPILGEIKEEVKLKLDKEASLVLLDGKLNLTKHSASFEKQTAKIIT